MTGPGVGPRSVAALFLERVRESPGDEAFRYPGDGGWVSLTWTDVRHDVRFVALGLHALGLRPEERCAILASTRVEWILADLGILCAGGATTTIYPSSTADECARVLAGSGARVCFADDAAQVAKLRSLRAALPALVRVVVFDGEGTADGWVVPWSRLLADGRAVHAVRPGAFDELVEALPRPAPVPDGALAGDAEPLQLLSLPLAHPLGEAMIALQLRGGFASVLEGRPERLLDTLAAVRPTILCALPCVVEQLRATVLQEVGAGAVAAGAVRAAVEALRLERAGRSPGLGLAARRALAERLVLRKVRDLLGGRVKLLVSAPALPAQEVEEFFAAAGIAVLDGLGLAEDPPPAAIDGVATRTSRRSRS